MFDETNVAISKIEANEQFVFKHQPSLSLSIYYC